MNDTKGPGTTAEESWSRVPPVRRTRVSYFELRETEGIEPGSFLSLNVAETVRLLPHVSSEQR